MAERSVLLKKRGKPNIVLLVIEDLHLRMQEEQ